MAAPPEKAGLPGSNTLPTRSSTLNSSTTAGGYASDEDAVPDAAPSDTVGLLLERLQAWKHACGYLENYVTATEKMQKEHSKEYSKVLKSLSSPLKEGHHFDQALGGIAGLFENLRSNTQVRPSRFFGLENHSIEICRHWQIRIWRLARVLMDRFSLSFKDYTRK